MSPIVPIVAILAAGGAGAAIWYFLRGEKAEPEPPPMPPGPAPGPSPRPDEPRPRPAPAPSAKTYCAAAGKHYDVDRWASPFHVATALTAMGYPVSASLKTASDRLQIKEAQQAFWDQKIGPYTKAKQSWIDGIVGPCFLIALSEAETGGKFVPPYGDGDDG